MNKIKFSLTIVISYFILTGIALPHVGLNYPKGGETFEVGEVVTIKWEELVNHGSSNWDLYFSSNAGLSWEPIATDLPQDTTSYNWTVPNVLSNSCQIRIVQDNQINANYNDDSDNFIITAATTDVSDRQNIVEKFILYPAYPNPFNPTTHIEYSIPQKSFVSLKIYDAIGNEVTTLVNGEKAAGSYGVELNASGWASGLYFYRLQAVGVNPDLQKDFVQTKKIILLK